MVCAVLVSLYLALGCSGPAADGRFVGYAPSLETFPPVGEVIGSHCGSLDCHGQKGRNLRVYSGNGLRIDEVSGGATTPDEYSSTYDSLISIDPEVLSAVVQEGGQKPERWIVISKGRGREAHKGEVAMEANGEADRCVVSWLAALIDEAACTAAAEVLPPEAP